MEGQLAKRFKSHGLFLQSDACSFLVATVEAHSLDLVQLHALVDSVAATVTLQKLTDTVLTRVLVEGAVQKIRGEANAELSPSDRLEVIDAFSVPKFTYILDRKTFIPAKMAPVLHARDALSKAKMFSERFQVLRHRSLRNKLFAPKYEGAAASTVNDVHFELSTIDAITSAGARDAVACRAATSKADGGGGNGDLSDDSVIDDDDDNDASFPSALVVGLLSQLPGGQYCLEDQGSYMAADISRATCCNGLFTENCVVIAKGRFRDGVFFVSMLAFPPPEQRVDSLMLLGDMNLFGGTTRPKRERESLQTIEARGGDMFVVLSDVWLDDSRVAAKLRQMFEGYAAVTPPPVFVLMGNFVSDACGSTDRVRVLRESLDALADMAVELGVHHHQFVFVPGPRDPGISLTLPRPPLPAVCARRFQDKVRHAVFASNPARVRFLSQELVFFREDIANKMRRNCVALPRDDSDMEFSAHLVKTLIDQAHLCPLPIHVVPVYWEFEHALRLLPLPDVLVLADKYDGYTLTYEGCTVFNPGSFVTSNYTFMVYYPAKLRSNDRDSYERRVEFSKID